MQNTRQILGFLNLLKFYILDEFVHCTIKFSIYISKFIINADILVLSMFLVAYLVGPDFSLKLIFFLGDKSYPFFSFVQTTPIFLVLSRFWSKIVINISINFIKFIQKFKINFGKMSIKLCNKFKKNQIDTVGPWRFILKKCQIDTVGLKC
ncbi:hypothetical protein BpHYR1_019390 [Brachionus plicatilis]|uniref:Uncharacterized protein n=1 Tax=Brachionus plicatilis TaxID=10195 RepID=A0A3M7RVC8_BRAPC|nr:hypothetical protein BpHYR1_019390 [Brachionus plicatilis]